MSERVRKRFDVLVVGAGPAGLAAAAAAAASAGAEIGLVDDNPDVGGQIWRDKSKDPKSEAAEWAARLADAHVEVLLGTRVLQHGGPAQSLIAEKGKSLFEIEYSKLILATGARERFLPFPGWTLPNVMAPGGLQAMVKAGLPITGKRVVVAGTGPLLLAVAAYIRRRGANVRALCEQASWRALSGFAFGLLGQPGKIRQALTLRREVRGVPFWPNTWPVRALGKETLESVVLSRGGKLREMACDYLACGFHLVPNTELAFLLGCRIESGFVVVDELGQTSVPGVFCAGEPTGIGGVDIALLEGQIAGLAASGRREQTHRLRQSRRKERGFTERLKAQFALRPELKALPDSGTIVCRCEDVTHERASVHTCWRDAKNQTRCGMGPCQGRVCGPSTEFLYGWRLESIRPPIFPARIQSLSMVRSLTTGGSQ